MLSTTSLGCKLVRVPVGYPEHPGKSIIPAKVILDIAEPAVPLGAFGEGDLDDFVRSSLIGSRSGCVSTPGLGTVDVKSIHSGLRSDLASCWTSESSSVDDTVT